MLSMHLLHALTSTLFLALMLLAAPLASAERLKVVSGNSVCHDLVRTIGGDRVDASSLMATGVDPHNYQPVPDDVRRLAEARLVVINGLGFEGWFEGLATEAKLGSSVIIASTGITPLTMEEACDHGQGHGHSHGHQHSHGEVPDPHAFNAITFGIRYAENIRDALIAADAAGEADYRQRTEALVAQMRAADGQARKQLAVIPKAKRVIITNHDALQYFAVAYGFRVISPNTALEDSQPSAKTIASIVDLIKEEQVRGIFLEYGKHQKVVQQIAAEAGVRVGGELYLDGLGAPGTPAETYIGAFLHNVTTIAEALR
jgi:zinc/manganese transport system substrate-binding protein